MGAVIVALVLAVPAAAFTFWPFLRQRDRPAPLLPLPSDEREQLTEAKRAALRALRELDFEHAAGHVSDADYAGLRARYEAETADTLRALDALGPAPAVPAPAEERPTPAPARGWRHPAALGAAAVGLLVFGVAIGVGIVRYTEPDRMADTPPAPGSRPLASLDAPSAAAEAPSAANAPRGPVTPQMLQGMLEAARASLFAGRYGEAIAAYQAVLKRDPNNVDALTHMGLIAAVAARGEHGLALVDDHRERPDDVHGVDAVLDGHAHVAVLERHARLGGLPEDLRLDGARRPEVGDRARLHHIVDDAGDLQVLPRRHHHRVRAIRGAYGHQPPEEESHRRLPPTRRSVGRPRSWPRRAGPARSSGRLRRRGSCRPTSRPPGSRG